MSGEKKNDTINTQYEILLKELEIEKEYYNYEHERASIIDNKANVVFGFAIAVLGLSFFNANFRIEFDNNLSLTIYNFVPLLVFVNFVMIIVWFLKIYFAKSYKVIHTKDGANTNYLDIYIKDLLKEYREINLENCIINDNKVKNLNRLNIAFIFLIALLILLRVIIK